MSRSKSLKQDTSIISQVMVRICVRLPGDSGSDVVGV